METFIIATDFSQSAENAAKYAASLSKSMGIKRLLLYHSYEIVPTLADVPGAVVLADERLQEQRSEFLEELKQDLIDIDKDLEILTVANASNVDQGINDLAAQYDGVLAVIGLSGKTLWEKLLLGSSTRQLLSACQLPVLVVPSNVSYTPIEKVVLGCDLKNVSETIPAKKIKDLVEQLKAQLMVVHVDHHEELHFNADIIREQYAFYDLFEDLEPSIGYIDDNEIAKGILTYAEEHEAQLIVVVAKKHGFLERILKESVSKKLALKARVPLLIFQE